MKRSQHSVKALLVVAATIILGSSIPSFGDQLYAPPFLWERGISSKTDPVDIANLHVGIPYRDDGALDDKGHFTTFADPKVFFDTPGLNCSGLVLSVSRYIFNKNWSMADAVHDRLGDSGAGSQYGKDWDFGWDLALNLTEGRNPRVIMPDGGDHPIEGQNGMTLRGFELADAAAWAKVLPQLTPGHVYIGSISKPGTARGYKVMHYHVVLILSDTKGGIWLYHATHRSNVHKININTPQGMSKFMGQFRNARGETKKILLVEATLPTAMTTAGDSAAERKDVRSKETAPPPEAGPEQSPTMGSNPPGPAPQVEAEPQITVTHVSGKVYTAEPELVTSLPKVIGADQPKIRFLYTNTGNIGRKLDIKVKEPGGQAQFKGVVPEGKGLSLVFPDDFSVGDKPLARGQYIVDVSVDGQRWLTDVLDVDKPKEAQPKILKMAAPDTVQAGRSFQMRIEAQNHGAESDYGGITVSSGDPSGLRIVGAKPGKVFGVGSTVLSITTDRMRTKTPMAERWIEIWPEDKTYDMTVQVQALKPGVYSLYIRAALRGVNVKSSVVLMDPAKSDVVDQQGFPVYVKEITVK